MISILLVDDDHAKTNRILAVVKDAFLGSKFSLKTAANVYAAGQLLVREMFDLMVLDLSIPMRDGEGPRSDGGLCLLRSFKSNRSFRRPMHIIGLTAFDELCVKHKASFQEEAWVLLTYEEKSDAWEAALRHKLIHIAETKEVNSGHEVRRGSPWIAGSFYLFAFLVVIAVLCVLGGAMPLYTLAIVVIASLLIVPAIGFLQLRHDGLLKDKSFVELYKACFSHLHLLRGEPKPDRPAEHGEKR